MPRAAFDDDTPCYTRRTFAPCAAARAPFDVASAAAATIFASAITPLIAVYAYA